MTNNEFEEWFGEFGEIEPKYYLIGVSIGIILILFLELI